MKKSYIVLHIAVILAGFTGVFGKLISLNEGLLVFYRVLFSTIILFGIQKFSNNTEKLSFREKINIGKIGLFITIHWVFFYASIKYSNISIGVVCYCLTSFFTAVFNPLINRVPFKISELLLSMLTLAGIAMIFHFDSSYQLGIMLGGISSAFAALYTIYNERLVNTYDSRQINFYQMTFGTIGLGAVLPVYLCFFPAQSLLPNMTDVFYLLFLAAFCTVTLYILFAESLKRLSAFTVNLSFNLEPVYAIILAFIFFNEGKEVNLAFYAGLSFVMLSVILQSVFSRKK